MKTDVQELKARLEEVGCDEKLTDQVIAFLLNGDTESARMFLRRHRKQLMEELHESEKRVDDLDLLVYQISKEKL
ncbi:MAG: hypothetical protein MJ116_09625 [Lachnospiraceae bacterium]|nr:hypothetical protein [Lachnospiraceae bacterium]